MPPAVLSPADHHPFVGLDVPTLLAHRAVTRRDHPFIVWAPFEGEAETWTYGRFHDRVGRGADGLRPALNGGDGHRRRRGARAARSPRAR